MNNSVDNDELAEKVRSYFRGTSGSFSPCAFYEEPLERITVLVCECSVCEVSMNDTLTLVERSYPEGSEDKYVGFVIEHAYYFCRDHGLLSAEKTVDLNEVLTALLSEFPEISAQIEIAKGMLGKLKCATVSLAS